MPIGSLSLLPTETSKYWWTCFFGNIGISIGTAAEKDILLTTLAGIRSNIVEQGSSNEPLALVLLLYYKVTIIK